MDSRLKSEKATKNLEVQSQRRFELKVPGRSQQFVVAEWGG